MISRERVKLAINHKIYEQCSYRSGPVHADDFITSKTGLSFDNYGDAPRK